MRLLSVNIGQPRRLEGAGKPGLTGIFKEPTLRRVRVQALGLAGDHVMDTRHHGGPDQAVYLYSDEDYRWWAGQLGQRPPPGHFGENLTLSSFGADTVRVGDRYRIGSVLLEVTAPRIPCGTFAARMEDAQWVKRFRAARRPGLYARVLEEGELEAGDPVTHLPGPTTNISVTELFDAWYAGTPDPALLRRILASPIASRARRDYERKLAESP